VDRDGYGRINVKQRNFRAHRLSYEIYVGPIEAGLELDHLCEVRRCIRPEHLEPVSHRENAIRVFGRGARNDNECRNGHELAGDNVYELQGQHYCRECHRTRNREYAATTRRAQAKGGAA
jgi:hypothetical protein